jgi:hypothetical protein
MRVRNAMSAPFQGRTRIESGQVGDVDPDRPGVRALLKLEHLVALDDVPGAPDPAAELAALRVENTALRAAVAERDATIGALRATVDGLTASDRVKAPALPSAPPAAAAPVLEAADRPVDPSAKSSKKGG